MTAAESLYRWNTWYDGLPQNWRFQVVLWPLIAVGTLNMILTLGIRFPFGLLVLLALICVAAIRVPYVLGWVKAEGAVPSDKPSAPRIEIANAGWLVDLNRRYDALSEFQAIWLVAGILLVAGAINMLLTIGTGFPFGLIFLLAILALLVVRAPYTAGFLKAPRPGDGPVPAVEYAREIAPAPSAANRDEAYAPAPMAPAPDTQSSEMPAFNPNRAATSSVGVEEASRTGHDEGGSVSSLSAEE